jgi:hypothetical protein
MRLPAGSLLTPAGIYSGLSENLALESRLVQLTRLMESLPLCEKGQKSLLISNMLLKVRFIDGHSANIKPFLKNKLFETEKSKFARFTACMCWVRAGRSACRKALASIPFSPRVVSP